MKHVSRLNVFLNGLGLFLLTQVCLGQDNSSKPRSIIVDALRQRQQAELFTDTSSSSRTDRQQELFLTDSARSVIAKDESTSCVVTNFHVIENATSVTVMDYLGNAYEGTLCAMPVNDEDLCLLLIDTTKIPAIRSVKPYDEVKVGSDVFAIGHPVGQTYSLTEGIISAKREERYLQTNTPISSGNSGGPLFLEHTGELAGINTLALHEAQDEESVVQNLNFAERADIVYDRNTWNFTPGTPSSIQEALPNGRMQ